MSVGPLRARINAACSPLVQDVVITGHDRAKLGALVFPNAVVCRDLSAAELRARLQPVFERLARESTGSSTRIARAMIMEQPPSIDAGEVTDKGSINQRAVLKNRAALVERLYAEPPGRRSSWHRAMNLDDLVAIDVHTHAGNLDAACCPTRPRRKSLEARGRYFRYQVQHPTIAQMAAYYRERKMAFVVFTVDHERGMGIQRISNEEVAESAHEHADVAIPFASIDPARGKMGVREARRLIKDYGVRGFKFHPIGAGLLPQRPRRLSAVRSDRRGEAAGAVPHRPDRHRRRHAGRRRPAPQVLEPDAISTTWPRIFPDMPIIMAHPSVPWQDEALSVATHKPNVYIDLSGWSPKYFEPKLVQYANTLLKDRVLFGTDNPGDPPDRWLADFDETADQAGGAAADPEGKRGASSAGARHEALHLLPQFGRVPRAHRAEPEGHRLRARLRASRQGRAPRSPPTARSTRRRWCRRSRTAATC